MECVFSTEELVNCNPSGITKLRDTMRQQTIKMLEPAKIKFIDSMLCTICYIYACESNI